MIAHLCDIISYLYGQSRDMNIKNDILLVNIMDVLSEGGSFCELRKTPGI